MNKFNDVEFDRICSEFKGRPYCKEIVINAETNGFFNRIRHNVATDRRGEVVFCVERPNGKIVTVTCEEYPEGIFRIPTGGIGFNEDIIQAVFRETKEELGVNTQITDFIGVLKLRFEFDNEYEMFYSYLFLLKEIGGNILVDASDDEISEIKEVDLEGLEGVAASLACIKGEWYNWGVFRYQTTNAILQFLKHKKGLID